MFFRAGEPVVQCATRLGSRFSASKKGRGALPDGKNPRVGNNYAGR